MGLCWTMDRVFKTSRRKFDVGPGLTSTPPMINSYCSNVNKFPMISVAAVKLWLQHTIANGASFRPKKMGCRSEKVRKQGGCLSLSQ